MGEWIDDGAEATVRDFDPDVDTIAVGVAGGTAAGLKLTDFDDGSGTSVVLNGVEIARVAGGQDLTRGDIALFDPADLEAAVLDVGADFDTDVLLDTDTAEDAGIEVETTISTVPPAAIIV